MPASYEKENEHFHNYNSSPSTCHSVSATTCALDACSPSDEDDLLTLLRHKNTNHNNNEKKNHHLHDQQEKEEVEEERHAVATCQQDCIPYDYDEALYEDEDEEGDDKHNNNNNKSEEGDDEGEEKAPEPFSPAWLAQQHAMAAARKAAAQQAYTERKTKELNLFHSTYYYSNDNKDRHPINMFHIKALLREACYEDMQMLKHQSEEAFADAVLPFYHRVEQVPYRLSHPSALAASAAITCPAPAAAAAPAALTPRGSDHACNNDSQTKLSIIVNNNNNSNNINYYDCEEEEDDDSLLSPTTLRNKNMFEKEKQHLLLTYERLKVQQHINDNDGNNNNNNKRHEILVLLKEVYIKAARLQWRKVQKDMEQYISFLSISLNNNNNNNNNSSSSSSNNSNNAPLIKQKSTLLLSAMSSMSLFQQDHILRFHTQNNNNNNNNNNTDHANSSSVLIREAFCMKEVERQCSRRLQRSAQLLRDLKEQNVLFVPPPTPPPTPASPSLLHSEMCESRDTLYSNENENEKEMEEEDDDNVFGSDDGETTCDTILSANLTPEVSYSNVNITSGEGTEQQQCMTAAFQLPSSSFFDFCTSFTNSTNYYHRHQQQQQQLEQQEQHAFIPNEVDADGKEEEEDADSSALAAAAAAFNHARGRSTSGGTSAVLSASNSLASLDSEANGYVTTPNMHSSRAHHHHHHHHQNHHSLSHASPHTHINNNNNNNNHLYPYSYSRHINASAENSPVKTYNKPHRYEADSTKGAIGANYEIANKAIRLNKNHFSFPSPPFQAHAAGAPMEAHPPFSF